MFLFFSFVVYDLLTGKLVRKIRGHTGCVRDVSWHPLDYNLITSSVSKICLLRTNILKDIIYFERKRNSNYRELFVVLSNICIYEKKKECSRLCDFFQKRKLKNCGRFLTC